MDKHEAWQCADGRKCPECSVRTINYLKCWLVRIVAFISSVYRLFYIVLSPVYIQCRLDFIIVLKGMYKLYQLVG